VKRLYRRFEVNSRAQLLARLSQSPLVRAPRLCVNLLESDDDHRFDSISTAEAQGGSMAKAVSTFPFARAARA